MNSAPLGVPVDPEVKHTQTGLLGSSLSTSGLNERTRIIESNFSKLSDISTVSTEISEGIPSNSSVVAITRSGSAISQIDFLSVDFKRGFMPVVIAPIFDAAI